MTHPSIELRRIGAAYERAPHLRCACTKQSVPFSDSATADGRTLIVHGLYHCFSTPIARAGA